MWVVLMSEVWEEWYRSLTEREQDALVESIGVLREYGPSLTRPHADTLKGSKFPNMRELRTQVGGQPYRSLYAFDPKRQAILLCGGDKTGDGRFYERMIPLADKLFAEHLDSLDE